MRTYTTMLVVLVAISLVLTACGGGGSGGKVDTIPKVDPKPVVIPNLPDPSFDGQEALHRRIHQNGGFKGILAISDEAGTPHATLMLRTVTEEGIPEANIRWLPFLGGDQLLIVFEKEEYRATRDQTKVMVMPILVPVYTSRSAQILRENDIFLSVSAGNTLTVDSKGVDMDFWNPNHKFWTSGQYGVGNKETYDLMLKEIFPTEKVAIAAIARRDEKSGRVWHSSQSVICGDAARWCFTVVYPTATYPDGTSDASGRLGAIAFYIRQLEGMTAEKTMQTLRACAKDLGDSGVDRVFGNGEPSVDCSQVKGRAVATLSNAVQQSVSLAQATAFNASPANVQRQSFGSAGYEDPSLVTPLVVKSATTGESSFAGARANLGEGFSLSYLENTRTVAIGHTNEVGPLQLSLYGGSGDNPLGVHSPYREANSAQFVQAAVKAAAWETEQSLVALSASYGEDFGHSQFSSAVAEFGVSVSHKATEKSTLSLKAGHKVLSATAGLPGYRTAGAGKTSATAEESSVHVAFTTKF